MRKRLCRYHVKFVKLPQPKFLGNSIWSNWFGQHTHHIFDKGQNRAFSTKVNVASPGQPRQSPGLKLSPSNGNRIFNKDLTRFLQSLSFSLGWERLCWQGAFTLAIILMPLPVSFWIALLRNLWATIGLNGEKSSWLCQTRPNKSSITFNRPWKRGLESSTSCHAVKKKKPHQLYLLNYSTRIIKLLQVTWLHLDKNVE